MFNSLKCKLIALVCLLSLAIFSSSVNANPKPLGFEIGVATYENIKDRFYSSRDEGINLFTNGHMLSVNSIELEVDGLQQAFFIFNDDKTLAAVNLKFDKNKFDEITSQLSKKYKTIKKIRPFVGNCYAKYKNDRSTITVDAPHMSFEMNVLYAHDNFLKIMNRTLNKKEKDRKNKQASLL